MSLHTVLVFYAKNHAQFFQRVFEKIVELKDDL